MNLLERLKYLKNILIIFLCGIISILANKSDNTVLCILHVIFAIPYSIGQGYVFNALGISKMLIIAWMLAYVAFVIIITVIRKPFFITLFENIVFGLLFPFM